MVSPRIISTFLYSRLKAYWKPDVEDTTSSNQNFPVSEEIVHNINNDANLFAMEKHLEEFLIANLGKTIFGSKYELINDENSELVSEQSPTGVSQIDILAKDKKSGQFVIIELKRGQTSDDTVGQLLRYMGWIEENVTKGEPTHGIIIAATPDKRLHYVLKKLKGNVDLYVYQVNFILTKRKTNLFVRK